jgi:hypothetical protein
MKTNIMIAVIAGVLFGRSAQAQAHMTDDRACTGRHHGVEDCSTGWAICSDNTITHYRCWSVSMSEPSRLNRQLVLTRHDLLEMDSRTIVRGRVYAYQTAVAAENSAMRALATVRDRTLACVPEAERAVLYVTFGVDGRPAFGAGGRTPTQLRCLHRAVVGVTMTPAPDTDVHVLVRDDLIAETPTDDPSMPVPEWCSTRAFADVAAPVMHDGATYCGVPDTTMLYAYVEMNDQGHVESVRMSSSVRGDINSWTGAGHASLSDSQRRCLETRTRHYLAWPCGPHANATIAVTPAATVLGTVEDQMTRLQAAERETEASRGTAVLR